MVAAVLALGGGAVQAAGSSYVQGLLDATPGGGWVKANVGKFSDAFPTGADAVPDITEHTLPGGVVRAWSAFAWDSSRSNLLIYGGGHNNYRGNEVYSWSGNTGNWSRGSLPSKIENYVPPGADPRTFLVVDDAAPQSAHTYDGNLYLPKNDMFLTLGGGVYNSGDIFQTRNAAGDLVRAGPWLWDPNKADANKVGGTTGSGYNPSTLGGNMWTNRQGQWTGTEPRGYSNNTTAYRTEGNRDVVYMTAPAQYSGFPALYRYTLGDVRNGGTDTWERIGESYYAPSGQGTAVIDAQRNLYVHTAAINGSTVDLGVWDLSKANALNSDLNRDIAVELVEADGTPFIVNVKADTPKAEINAANVPSAAIKITVSKNGFEPSEIKIEKDKPVKLAFYRADTENCGGEVVFAKLNISKKLPVGETVLVEFTPTDSGEISFSCGMNMMKGKVLVQ